MKSDVRVKHELLIILLCAGMMFTLGSITFWWSINRPPVIKIPKRRTVSPNAIKYYIVAAKKIKQYDFSVLQWAICRYPETRPAPTPMPPPGPGASPGMPGPGSPPMPGPGTKPKIPADTAIYDPYALATLAEKQALLKDNLDVLKKARLGFRYECLVPSIRYTGTDTVYVYNIDQLSDIFVLEGQSKELLGNWNDALSSYIDSIRIASDTAHGGGIENADKSITMQRIANQNAWVAVNHVDAATAHLAVKRLSAIIKNAPSYADILQEESYHEISELADELKQKDWRIEWARTFSQGEQRIIRNRILCFTASKRRMIEFRKRMFQEHILNASKPYPLDRIKFQFNSDFKDTIAPQDWYPGRFSWEYIRTMNGLLMTSLALRAWKLEHGNYPKSLQGLMPNYLDKLPNDPFAISGTFKYHLRGSSYILYSLGPDSRDNGGKPVIQAFCPSPFYKSSKGDIVAGVTDVPPALPHRLVKPPARPLPREIKDWIREDYALGAHPGAPPPMP